MEKRGLSYRICGSLVLAGLLSLFMTPLVASASFRGSDATTAKPKLTITPSEIYYPCSEGNVTFAVKAFADGKKVALHSGSKTGPKVATITTNSKGSGKTVIDFTNEPPGSYPYYAVLSKESARATLMIGTCP
jgi:hypothetical protein